MRCKYCGAILVNDSEICFNCGKVNHSENIGEQLGGQPHVHDYSVRDVLKDDETLKEPRLQNANDAKRAQKSVKASYVIILLCAFLFGLFIVGFIIGVNNVFFDPVEDYDGGMDDGFFDFVEDGDWEVDDEFSDQDDEEEYESKNGVVKYSISNEYEKANLKGLPKMFKGWSLKKDGEDAGAVMTFKTDKINVIEDWDDEEMVEEYLVKFLADNLEIGISVDDCSSLTDITYEGYDYVCTTVYPEETMDVKTEKYIVYLEVAVCETGDGFIEYCLAEDVDDYDDELYCWFNEFDTEKYGDSEE